MMGVVHAAIGAAVGSLCGKKRCAFAAGVASHIAADALPHKDYPPAVEVPLMAAGMFALAVWKGFDSPAFWGAVGGISPDVEHGLMETGIISKDQEIFPTHIDDGRYHGRESNERWSQLAIALASVVTVALAGNEQADQSPEASPQRG